MAWQLIYTSAPRLLEAGRSGFGSVARHRQISPLLVSAIERASQFSRQPGMDPGRVIFSHRIIPISGGRFHVLSCIRDSGADYTGRTNHIAHHLIAEAREVAQLGSPGASPADVLLAMPWLAKWDDPPHYFEAADEVPLAEFSLRAGADGAHWAPVTGSAAHAWLLASGEASRGAYVIPPSGVDLRWLFADSLRLAPERLWQTTFTTSLQSRDEISDFRWIGLDHDSPLRNETGASGRVTLDLTQPHLLPVPEGAAKTDLYPSDSSPLEAQTEPTAGQDVEIAPAAPRTYSYRPIFDTPPPAPPKQSPPVLISPPPASAPLAETRRFPVWIVWTLAAILLAAALVFAVFLPWKHLSDLRGKLVTILKWSEYFPDQSLNPIAQRLLPDANAWPVAEERAQAVNRIATALVRGQLETILPTDEKQLHALIEDGAAPPPPEITHLQSLLDSAKGKSRWKPDLKSASEAPRLQRSVSDDINTAIPASPYEKLNRALRTLSDQRIAEAEYDLLARDTSMQPPESISVFKTSLSELKTRMSGNDQALASLEKAGAIVALWELTESPPGSTASEKIGAIKKRDGQNAAKWPLWLSKKLSALLNNRDDKLSSKTAPGSKIPALPPVPLYVVANLAALKDAHFDELRGKLTYFIQSPTESEPRPLRDPGNEGKLRLNISEDPVFLVNETDAQIIPQRAAESFQTPLILIARDAPGHDAVQIWVAGSEKAFLPDRKARVTRAANLLSVKLEDLSLPGAFKTPLKLRLPDECNISGIANASLPLVDGKADIAGLLKEIRERRDAKADEIQTLGMLLAPRSANPKVDFATRKYLVIQAARLDNDLRRKDSQASQDLGSDTAPLYQQCGNLLVAIARPAPFSGADKLFEIGKQLSSAPPNDALLAAASAAAARARSALSEDIQRARNSGGADQEIERLKKIKELYDPVLFRLKELIDGLLPETSDAKAAQESLRAQIREKLKSSRLEMDHILAHPLLLLPSDGAPAGTYELLARTAQGDEVLLLKLEVTR